MQRQQPAIAIGLCAYGSVTPTAAWRVFPRDVMNQNQVLSIDYVRYDTDQPGFAVENETSNGFGIYFHVSRSEK
jgi:hypothetical protein